jgi:hypothetical protein
MDQNKTAHAFCRCQSTAPERTKKKNTTIAQQRILRSDKHHISLATGPQNGPQRKGNPIVVQLPNNRSRHPIFPKM